MADIVIGGRLHSAATGNTVAGANEIMDDAQGKKQSVVNQELANRISVAGQQQQASIEAEAEARAAKDRELKALIDQGIVEGGGIVFDTEPTPDSVNPVTSNGIAGTLGHNTDNVEFVRVLVDSQNRVVFGIQRDGNVYFGAGVPEQIQTYVRDMMATIDLTDITTTLEQITDYLAGKLGTQLTLSEELNGKVDKEEGKSLVDAEVAESFSIEDNPEFLKADTDSEGKVLAGIKKDGKVWMNDLEVDGKAFYIVTDSPEWLKVVTDSDGKVITGIRKDGSTYIADLDAGGAIAAMLAEFEERIAELEDDIDAKMALFNAVFSEFTDPEGRLQITTDADDKILSYRDKDGVLHENQLMVEKKLDLGEDAMTDFQQALKAAGFQPGGGGDFSDREVIELPEPKGCALVNLIVDKLPLNDGEVSEGFVEYYDKYGNYFKIECSVEPQGQSSREFARTGGKGNYTLDISNDVKFGSWVPQDSFHLKGAAKDVVRGTLPTSYKLAYKVMNYLDAKPNRVLVNEDEITFVNGTGSRMTDWPDDARCLADGFPFELFLNGEYWGLYAWQLKKHRKNYSMDKKDYTSCFIDADGNMTDFWNGNILWNRFDIKGPKDLICMDGSSFDGDDPKELIDSTSSVYNPSDKKHKGSAQTKAIIKAMSTKYLEVKSLVDANNLVQAKEKFEEYFDVNACILVYIFNCTMNNGDSIEKNTLWGVWSDGKIAPMLWDLDAMYGVGWIGNTVNAPSAAMWNGRYATSSWPLALLWRLYKSDITTAYHNLRTDKIISMETWRDVIYGWCDRVGKEAFERDIEKWPETPSYRANNVNTDYWRIGGSVYGLGSYSLWNANASYNTGNIVAVKLHSNSNWYQLFTAVQQSTDENPVTTPYSEFPIVGGFYDSPKRWEKWIQEQLRLCDAVMEYNQ